MKRKLLIALILFSITVPFCQGAVEDITVSPENPIQGDTLDIFVKANPDETLPIKITFERELETVNGKYLLSVKDLMIPDPPNSFRVRSEPVEDMTVTLILGVRMSTTVTAVDGVARISQSDIDGEEYDTKIRGNAENGVDSVTVKITAESTLTTDSDGEYHYMFPTSDIPPGSYTANVDGETITVNVQEQGPPSDITPPTISQTTPIGEVTTSTPLISAQYTDDTEINQNSVKLEINNVDVTTQSTVTSTSISYQASGLLNQTTYNIELSVADSQGNQATDTWSFTVNLPPPPDITPPQITDYHPKGTVETESTTIMASVWDNKKIDTVLLRLDGSIVNPRLDGDMVSYDLENLKDGETFNIELIVRDEAGNEASESWSFTVELPEEPIISPNQKPVPVISYPKVILTNIETVLDASESYDPDGLITQYQWTIESQTYTGVRASHRFNQPGLYNISLMVTDNRGEFESVNIPVNVLNSSAYRPEAKAGSSRNGFTNQTITFDASESNSLYGEIIQYIWSFGDGSTGTGAHASHRYEAPGEYNVTLSIMTSLGGSSNDSLMVKIDAQPSSMAIKEKSIEANAYNCLNYTEMGVFIKLNSTRMSKLLLFQYPENAFNSSKPPNNGKFKVLDLGVSDPDAIEWPLYFELSYNESIQDEEYLGLYYYSNGSWSQCSETGVDPERNIVWAYITRHEASGSPITIAETLRPANITHIETIITPIQPKVEEPVTITLEFRNTGEVLGQTLIAITVDMDALKIDTLYVEPLSQSTYTYLTNFTSPGEHVITVQDENIQIHVQPLLPDLRITKVEHPTTYNPGKPFRINVTIANIGETNSIPTTLRVLGENKTITETPVEAIPLNSTTKYVIPLTLDYSEKYNLTITIDPDNIVDELDETNNKMDISLDPETKDYRLLVVAVTIFVVVMVFFREKISSVMN